MQAYVYVVVLVRQAAQVHRGPYRVKFLSGLPSLPSPVFLPLSERP